MFKKQLLMAVLVLMVGLTSLVGCQKMGKTTGQAVDEVQESAQEFEEGYEEGKTDG